MPFLLELNDTPLPTLISSGEFEMRPITRRPFSSSIIATTKGASVSKPSGGYLMVVKVRILPEPGSADGFSSLLHRGHLEAG
jgi:hypothetical protein